MSGREFHPLVKQLLDGEITLAALPVHLRPEGEEALRLLAAVDRRAVQLSDMTQRVMQELAQRGNHERTIWRRITAPREVRIRFRPWLLAPALAAAAALIIWLGRPEPAVVPSGALVTVRFVLSAPGAREVTVAGTFNQWDSHATPLVRNGSNGVWTATITLPIGQHQYAFVVDGQRWVPDPAAPAVDDGFGRRNSILTL